jgi:hypothetical protein
MEHFAYLVISTFAMAFASPLTWLIGIPLGLFINGFAVIALFAALLRGGLGWVFWLLSPETTEKVNPSLLETLVFMIPQVAAIVVIALAVRTIREYARRDRPDRPQSRRTPYH